MRSDLDHLPERQQRELERVRDTLLAGFEAAKNGGGGGTSTWRRGGMVLKIILFGSYARTDWVDASPEDLEWLMTRARLLRDRVSALCQTRIAELEAKAEIT